MPRCQRESCGGTLWTDEDENEFVCVLCARRISNGMVPQYIAPESEVSTSAVVRSL